WELNGHPRPSVPLTPMGLVAYPALLAAKTWTKTGGGNWNTAGNWSGGVPVSGDSVQIDQSLAGAYTVTLNVSSASRAGLTVGNSNATLALSAAGTTLAVNNAGTSTTSLTAGTINISATSTLSTGGFSESGGSFIESAGSLSVTGTAAPALSVTAGSF